jgi:hypothetical protein
MKRLSSPRETLQSSYDVIVVGAGYGGGVVPVLEGRLTLPDPGADPRPCVSDPCPTTGNPPCSACAADRTHGDEAPRCCTSRDPVVRRGNSPSRGRSAPLPERTITVITEITGLREEGVLSPSSPALPVLLKGQSEKNSKSAFFFSRPQDTRLRRLEKG